MSNSSFNSTSLNTNIQDTRSRVQVILQASFMGCIILFSVFGNVLLFLAVYTNRHLQNITSVFLVNLGCADALLALIGMPFTLVSTITFEWIFGDEMCNFTGILNFLFCIASISSLAGVAIERYVAITKPLRYIDIMTTKRVVIMIVMIWIPPLICGIFPVIGWSRYTFIKVESLCIFDFPASTSHTLYAVILHFTVPMLIIIFCYYKILLVARSHARRMRPVKLGFQEEPPKQEGTPPKQEGTPPKQESTPPKQEGTPPKQEGTDEANNPPSGSQKEMRARQKAEKNYKREAKAAKTLMIVIGTFLFCWAPHIIGILSFLVPGNHWPDEYFIISTWLAMLNSACNPVIYGLLNRRFRESYKKILCCKETYH